MTKLIPAILLLAFGAMTATAEVALGVRAGTLGAGADLTVAIPTGKSRLLNFRLNGNYLAFDQSMDLASNSYDFDFAMPTAGALLDYHPFGGAFKLVVGGYYNAAKVSMRAKLTDGGYGLDSYGYTPAEVGALTAEGRFSRRVAPYLGLGVGNPFGEGEHWSVCIDLGVILAGSPTFSLYSTGGTLSNDPAFRSALEAERRNMEDVAHKYRIYPVVSLSVGYKF